MELWPTLKAARGRLHTRQQSEQERDASLKTTLKILRPGVKALYESVTLRAL